MVKCRRFIFARRFDGLPKESDFQLVEEETPELKDGEILAESIFCSVDPYMWTFSRGLSEGVTMIGECCARVIESKSSDFPVGTVVMHRYGWCTHAVLDTKNKDPQNIIRKAPADYPKDLPLSLLLGAVGMPGMTAYFGLLKCLELKQQETVFVNAAAGAVGSVVGQIAKIKVGGDFTTAVLNHMNQSGRVAIVGGISTYNDKDTAGKGPYPYKVIQGKELTVRGFIVRRWLDQWPQGKDQMMQWIKEGKIKYREHVTEGFENMPKAFIGMLVGENTGKAVVKL